VHRTVPLARVSALSRQTSTFQTPSEAETSHAERNVQPPVLKSLVLPIPLQQVDVASRRAVQQGSRRQREILRDTLFFESKRLALWECFDVNCCRVLGSLKFGKLADNVLLIILMKFFCTRNAQKVSGLAT
jgi:hypothetical protein